MPSISAARFLVNWIVAADGLASGEVPRYGAGGRLPAHKYQTHPRKKRPLVRKNRTIGHLFALVESTSGVTFLLGRGSDPAGTNGPA
ncbi:hypothetical protein DESC_150052 [Desulfosarcina cetonica]|nr:hypothetical protein DESC_150052 [Desulfosarcina cetonica]